VHVRTRLINELLCIDFECLASLWLHSFVAADAGTDVLGMRTTAKLSQDKRQYVLNGTKMWITNGTLNGTDTADMYLVYAKTGSGRGMGDITTFIVEKGMPGFHLGQKIRDKCGMRASNTAELVFDNVSVSAALFP
jgi:isovaleryl-CoA dehydrogenase